LVAGRILRCRSPVAATGRPPGRNPRCTRNPVRSGPGRALRPALAGDSRTVPTETGTTATPTDLPGRLLRNSLPPRGSPSRRLARRGTTGGAAGPYDRHDREVRGGNRTGPRHARHDRPYQPGRTRHRRWVAARLPSFHRGTRGQGNLRRSAVRQQHGAGTLGNGWGSPAGLPHVPVRTAAASPAAVSQELPASS